MDFPSLRFLRSFIVQNKKMSKVQKRLLLLARMLTLLFLVLGFAQPLWNKKGSGDRQQAAWVVYIDNSLSMEASSGQQSLLDIAKQKATEWIQSQKDHDYYIISNEALYQAQPLSKQEAIQAIQNIKISSVTVDPIQLANVAQSLQENLYKKNIELLVFSDFQKSVWTTNNPIELNPNLELLYFPIHQLSADPVNVFVDTAFFLEAPVDATQAIPLVIAIRKSGNAPALDIPFFVQINEQNRKSSVLNFVATDSVLYDTAMVQLSPGKWNQILTGVSTRFLPMDDSFFIAAQIATLTQVLIYNQGAANAYLSSAFAALSGVQPLQRNLSGNIENEDKKYALVALQGITSLSPTEGEDIKKILDEGGAVALFFGKNAAIQNVNEGLAAIGPISIQKIDTSLQQLVDLQAAHPLLSGVLQSIPEQVQLPYAHYAYKFKTGITAGAQDVMKFRDGSPFISQLNIGNGKLYLFASPLDPTAGSLITSHLFAPIVQKMTLNNASGTQYAATIDGKSSVWIQGSVNEEKQVYQLEKNQQQFIPRQQAKGMGTQLFIPENIAEAGFYQASLPQDKKPTSIGLNYNRIESDIAESKVEDLQAVFPKGRVKVFNNLEQLKNFGTSGTAFPFWKIAIALALLLFIWETYLLAKRGVPKLSKQASA